MSEKIEVKKEIMDFLLYSYFNIDPEADDSDERLIEHCASRAYLDLCRTLEFYYSSSALAGMNKEDREDYNKFKSSFISVEISAIVDEVVKLLANPSAFASDDNFDKWHSNLCDTMNTNANNLNYQLPSEKTLFKKNENTADVLYYGQIQKWVNMTIKYMLILGRWDDKFDEIKEYLHVPVDSYIMEAACSKNEKYGLGIEIYDKEKSLKWSKWDKEKYIKFQKDIRTALKSSKAPIDWEGPAWIEAANKKRKNADK